MQEHLFTSGHTACPGCGEAIAVRLVIDSAGKNTIITNNTGCLEAFSSKYPESSWRVPWIHSLFENAAAVASGIEAALKYKGEKENINVIAQADDGGTADIGLQTLSGMWERGQDILSICYDNESYMNTAVQRLGLTPYGANATTSPPGDYSIGNPIFKKLMPEIAISHGCVYVATATVGFPQDLMNKVKKALTMKGPKYLQIYCPCPLGWGYDSNLTYKIARLAVETGLYPIIELAYSKLISVRKIKPLPVEEYLKLQRRFRHILDKPEQIKIIQEISNNNIEKYGLRLEG